MTNTKRCSSCTRTLPVDAFTRDKNTSDGYATYCRGCRRASRAGRTPADQLRAAADQADRAISARASKGGGVDIQAKRAVAELRTAADRWH